MTGWTRSAATVAALVISLAAHGARAADTAPPEAAATPTFADAQAAIEAADWPTAQRILAALTLTQPQNADVWNLFGYTARNMNLTSPALEAYEIALSLEPEHLGALEYQGEMFVKLGRMDEAQANLTKLQDLCGDCEQALDLKAAIDAAPIEETNG